jgi:SAM-dependent methyltransferase
MMIRELSSLGSTASALSKATAEIHTASSQRSEDPMRATVMTSQGYETKCQDLYRYSAELFDIRYAQKDYAADAALFSRLLSQIHPSATTMLDVACGTGRHSEHLRSRYQIEGLDLSAELLQIARSRLPGLPLHRADMSNFDLERKFDIVACFFASITYLGSVERLRDACACMTRHLEDDGVLFIEPWLTPSAYRVDEVVHNVRRTPELTASWMYVMRRQGNLAVWDIHWLVGKSQSGVIHFVEREELNLFTAEECFAAMRDAGLDVFHHSRGLHGYGAYVARRKAWSSEEKACISEVLSA